MQANADAWIERALKADAANASPVRYDGEWEQPGDWVLGAIR
jgi:hypothetical protein